jgi:hypothetical protein
VLLHAFNVLRAIGGGSDEVKIFLETTALNKKLTESIRALAIISLSAFKDIVVPVQNL